MREWRVSEAAARRECEWRVRTRVCGRPRVASASGEYTREYPRLGTRDWPLECHSLFNKHGLNTVVRRGRNDRCDGRLTDSWTQMRNACRTPGVSSRNPRVSARSRPSCRRSSFVEDEAECSLARCETERWLNSFVIGLSLCPWAKPSLPGTSNVAVKGRSSSLAFIESEAARLARLPTEPYYVTALLAVCNDELKADFAEFMLFVSDASAMVERRLCAVQLVPFHPLATYEKEAVDDPANEIADDSANYSGRSPWPTIHLLRQCDVDTAERLWAEAGRETGEVSPSNRIFLRGLGLDRVRREFKAAFVPGVPLL